MKKINRAKQILFGSSLLLLVFFTCAKVEAAPVTRFVAGTYFGMLLDVKPEPAQISFDQGKGKENLKWDLSKTEFRNESGQKVRWVVFLNTYKGKGVGLEISSEGLVLKAFPAAF